MHFWIVNRIVDWHFTQSCSSSQGFQLLWQLWCKIGTIGPVLSKLKLNLTLMILPNPKNLTHKSYRINNAQITRKHYIHLHQRRAKTIFSAQIIPKLMKNRYFDNFKNLSGIKIKWKISFSQIVCECVHRVWWYLYKYIAKSTNPLFIYSVFCQSIHLIEYLFVLGHVCVCVV